MPTQYDLLNNVTEPKPLLLKEDSTDKKRTQEPQKGLLSSLLWILFTQILGLLWLAPIITLLVLNFSSYVIGPSVWCFRRRCSADSLSDDAIGKAKALDKDDHNALGALQFVAKALELWFGFVAVNLIYNVAMWLADRDDGLPIGLLHASVEFADPRSLLRAFSSARRSPLQPAHASRSASKLIIGLFVAFLVFMCLLVNLMGPATAVLVLPTLQWKDLNQHAKHTFRSLNLSGGPAGDNVFPECTNYNLSHGQYSCNTDSYAASLDSWVDITIAGESQSSPFINGSLLLGLSQEGEVLFTFNSTDKAHEVVWAPNRQVLRELSADLDNFQTAYMKNTGKFRNNTDPKYHPYTNSLQTILKRQGPVLGAYGGYYAPENAFNVEIGPNRSLRCYGSYSSTVNDTDQSQYNKCIRVGTGWNPSNSQASFTIAGSSHKETTHVDVYFSDKAAYYNSTYNPQLIPSACLVNHSNTANSECPWGSIFERRYIPPYLTPVSSNILTVELTMPNLYPGKPFILELFTLASYNSTYTLDTSPTSNPISLIQIDDIPSQSDLHPQTVVVDPNWFLAAWSVDQDGFLAQNRSAAIALVRGLKADFANTHYNDTDLGEDSLTAEATVATQTTPGTTGPTAATGAIKVRKRDSITNQTSTTSAVPTLKLAAATSFLLSAPNTVATAAETGTNAYTATSAFPTSAYPTTTLTPDSDEETEIPVDRYDGYEGDASGKNGEALYGFLTLSYLQALSMVDYSKDIVASNATLDDPSHPKLHYYAMVHVWAYGIDSRTSYLGVVVACAGMLCVVCSTILGLLSRRRQRSLTEITLAAIEHKHQGELADVRGDPEYAARLRYRVRDDDRDRKVRFHHTNFHHIE